MAARGRRAVNPAFMAAHNAQLNSNTQIHDKILSQARKSGSLNLSQRGLENVPDNVWRINIDAPRQGQTLSFEDSGDNWWEMIPLNKLILASNKLTNLSSNIQLLSGLTVLDLHDNQLTSIPDEISHLLDLKSLNLSVNKLSSLPNSLANCSELSNLQLQYNEFVTLPPVIENLTQLVALDLSFNSLQTVTDEIQSLHQLSRLQFKHNNITSVSPAIGHLINVNHVDFSENKLTFFPTIFLSPSKVEVIHLQQNRLENFPKIQNCPHLKELLISSNRIGEITNENLCHLNSLFTLDLASNRLSKLPSAIVQLKYLLRLDVSRNDLDTLPNELGHMEELSVLLVDGNPLKSIRHNAIKKGTDALKKLLRDRIVSPDGGGGLDSNNVSVVRPGQQTGFIGVSSSVVNVQQIRDNKTFQFQHKKATEISLDIIDALKKEEIHTISLAHNLFSCLPSCIMLFASCLRHLDLSCNRIKNLTDEIAQLNQLQTLNLTANQMATLPTSLSSLSHLLTLDVSQNPLHILPQCVYQLPVLETLLAASCKLNTVDAIQIQQMQQLRTLDLQGNEISSVPLELGLCCQLTCLRLEGNPFRAPRPAILAKGTLALLEYLKNRIPSA